MAGPILPADAWGRDCTRPLTPVPPVTYVIVHHSAGATYVGDVVAGMRSLDRAAHARGDSCIHYNIGHFQDGARAEGRGWLRRGAHTSGRPAAGELRAGESYNVCGHALVALGNFDTVDRPTPALIDALARSIVDGVHAGAIRADWQLIGHRDAHSIATACPGRYLHAALGDVERLARARLAPVPPPDRPAVTWKDTDVKTKLVEVACDGDGNGWTEWDPKLGRDPIVVAVSLHGPYPPTDGYWYDDVSPTVAAQARTKKTIVSVSNAQPGGRVAVWVSIA